MKSTPLNDEYFKLLVLEAIDGSITPERMSELNQILSSDPHAIACYIDFIDVQIQLKSLLSNIKIISEKYRTDSVEYQSLLSDMARIELSAPVLDLPEEMARRDSAQERISANQLHRKPISGKDRLRFLGRLAAIVMISVSLIWVDRWVWRKAQQPKAETDVVAMLADQIAAQWDPDLNLCFPDGRMPQGRYGILEGFVSMRFNSGAEVVLEGPAQWRLDTEDRMYLFHGKLYADVPKQAVGFSVLSAHAKVVDLGTEFGLEVTGSGSTELYVTLGKVSLLSGASRRGRYQEEVLGGSARRIDASGNIQVITLDSKRFVRQIDSRKNVVWRGHEHIDLADIVSGGNGMGTSHQSLSIHPGTGQIRYGVTPAVDPGTKLRLEKHYSDSFNAVLGNRFVDGVFVPNGQGGPQRVTSNGDLFTECPPTNSKCWIEIHNSARRVNNDPSLNAEFRSIEWNGITYHDVSHPAIVVHANAGITFDLKAISANLPEMQINRFESLCGLAELKHPQESIELWVLIDGQVQYRQLFDVKNPEPQKISIEIKENDRFLTLISTDGRRNATSPDATYSDWGAFAEPVLWIEKQRQR